MCVCRVPEECPPEIRDLCDKCMSADPRERPSAKQIVKVLEVAVGGVGRQLTIKGTPPWLASPKTSGPSGTALLQGTALHGKWQARCLVAGSVWRAALEVTRMHVLVWLQLVGCCHPWHPYHHWQPAAANARLLLC